MDPLSGAASVIAVVQLAGGIVKICGKYLSEVKDATQDIQRLKEKITALAHVLQSLKELIGGSDGNKLTATQDLVDDIDNCFSALTNLKEKIDPETTQKRMRKWGLRALKWPMVRSEVDSVIMELEGYKTTFALALQVDQTKLATAIHKKIDLSRLQSAKQAAFDSYDNQHSECLPGTRIGLLQEIEEWIKSPHGKCIFWLNGMAGTGKSTVSQTVARRLQEQKLLGASFFFRRNEEDRGTAKKLFPTLTEQLVIGIPQMLPGVQKAIDDDPNISEKALKEQFDKLLLDPLAGIEQRPGKETIRRVIVIDALDECESEDDIGIILRILPRVQKSTSVQIRFLLTSRPELPIRLGFKRITDAHQNLVLHEIAEPVIEHDISLYFEDQFLHLRERRSLSSDWPGAPATKRLVNRAIPLFIAAATVCRFIGDPKWNPQKRLDAILADNSTYVSKMKSTYIPVLNQLLTGQNETESQTLLEEFKEIVGVIIILATPLSINSLRHLVGKEPDDIKLRLDQLHSVLSVPTNFDSPVRLLHLSFRDFLLDHDKERKFWIDEECTNQRLAERCCQIMQDTLKENICELPSKATKRDEISNDLIQRYIPPDLQYACRYWVHHLERCKGRVSESEVLRFLKVHFLHWLEVLALIGDISKATGMIEIMKSRTWNLKKMDSELSGFLYEGSRFALQNTYIARVTPLQIYYAGLVFAPTTTIIKTTFQRKIPTQIKKLPMQYFWSPNLHTLEGHNHGVDSVAFSPDGSTLASSARNEIFLWDTTLGQPLWALTGHSRAVKTVAFSPNGSILASGSYDKTIILWEVAIGEPWKTLTGHSGEVATVAFSPDGSTLASGSRDHLIILWSMATCEQRTLGHHASWVFSVAFSASGQMLASGSHDNTIILWNIVTGQQQYILSDHLSTVSSVAFSLDGLVVASGSYDATIILWEVATGKRQRTLRGNDAVLSLAFDAVSGILASGQYDRTINNWDIATGELQKTLIGHTRSVDSLAFSTHGRMLASGSQDNTIKLWDLGTYNQQQQQIQSGHSSWIFSMAFSRDGSMLASGSIDGDILVWDVETGNYHTISGHAGPMNSLAFSPDGYMLASSGANALILWDIATGERRHTLIGSFPGPSEGRLVFSPDGSTLASSSDGIILWDTNTGKHRRTLDCDGLVEAMVFSPDRCTLALGLDQNVQLWNIVTGERQQQMNGLHSNWGIQSMAFSPDGHTLALNFYDNTLELWDTAADRRQTLNDNSGSVLSVNRSYFNTEVWVSKSWVFFRGEPLLFLPPEHSWFTCQTSVGCTLALGYRDGRVIILVFDT